MIIIALSFCLINKSFTTVALKDFLKTFPNTKNGENLGQTLLFVQTLKQIIYHY